MQIKNDLCTNRSIGFLFVWTLLGWPVQCKVPLWKHKPFSSPCCFMIHFRTAALFQKCPPLVAEVAPAVGLIAYSIWGLGPTTRMLRKTLFKVVWSILILALSILQFSTWLVEFVFMSLEILILCTDLWLHVTAISLSYSACCEYQWWTCRPVAKMMGYVLCRGMIRSGMKAGRTTLWLLTCDLYYCGLELFLFAGIVEALLLVQRPLNALTVMVV